MFQSCIRIFVALLLAVWMPLCCCQSAVLFGVGCEVGLEVRADSGDGCCSGSQVNDDSACEEPVVGNSTHPVKSCRCIELAKRAVSSDRDSAAKTVRVEQNEVSLPIAMLTSALGSLRLSETSLESLSCRDYAAPPLMKANRAVLRWHCALIV